MSLYFRMSRLWITASLRTDRSSWKAAGRSGARTRSRTRLRGMNPGSPACATWQHERMADVGLPSLATLLELPNATADPITERILDAALAEFTDYGLRRSSVDDIRRRAGVNRATVYRRFGSKNDLVEATFQRWILGLLVDTAAAVSDRPTVRERLVEGFVRSVLIVRTDALVGRLLTSEPETFVPYLTTAGSPILRTCREFLAGQCRELQSRGQAPHVDADAAAEIALRLAQSVVLTPDSYFGLADEAALRAFADRYVGPLAG